MLPNDRVEKHPGPEEDTGETESPGTASRVLVDDGVVLDTEVGPEKPDVEEPEQR